MYSEPAAKRCAYLKYCYLAEAAKCYGYKTDCPLYMATNEEPISEQKFHRAMDQLINKTKIKHQNSEGGGSRFC